MGACWKCCRNFCRRLCSDSRRPAHSQGHPRRVRQHRPRNARVRRNRDWPVSQHARSVQPLPGTVQRAPRYVRNVKSYRSYEDVVGDLRTAGLETSDLVVGIDFTSSNLKQGNRTFPQGVGRRGLHTILGAGLNPYERAIRSVGEVLSQFDDDGLIPVFGFGSVETVDCDVFPILPQRDDSVDFDPRFCHGFDEVLRSYRRVAPLVSMKGPTSFAPIIDKTIELIRRSKTAQFHILVILCDGAVNVPGETKRAIREACNWPISIVVVGIGDGPWEVMNHFDDHLVGHPMDNFCFVEANRAWQLHGQNSYAFAMECLQEVPAQYAIFKDRGILGKPTHGGRIRGAPDAYMQSDVEPALLPDLYRRRNRVAQQPDSVPYSDFQ